jgi:hypothetical protein
MKRNRIILWAGALPTLAFVHIPAAGQVRADRMETPDSAIVYTPNGQPHTKYVYLPGESFGTYTREHNAWEYSSTEPLKRSFYTAIYDREWNIQSAGVACRNIGGMLQLCYPMIREEFGVYEISDDRNYRPGYDINSNLTSVEIRDSAAANQWDTLFAVVYNEKDRPLSIERRERGRPLFKVHYEYNKYGYATLFDSYELNRETNAWRSLAKETAEYDAGGKLLFKNRYEDGKITRSESYTYYSENRYASRSVTRYEGGESYTQREEWKYGADRTLGVRYLYEDNDLLEYTVFYPNNFSATAVEHAPKSAAVRIRTSGKQLHIDAETTGTAQIYSVAGQRIQSIRFTPGQTSVTSLPPGLYIVAADGNTWKVAVKR